MSKNIGKDTHLTLNKQTQQARIVKISFIGIRHVEESLDIITKK